MEISYDDFTKLEMRVAKIESAEKVAGSDKLLKLVVDTGADRRQLVAGIADRYAPESLTGKNIIVLTNLKPRMIRGVESKGMLLAAEVEGKAVLLTTDGEAPVGALVR